MFFKREEEHVKPQPKYKATYKCLHCGATKEIYIANPRVVRPYVLHENEGIYEMYILTSVTPLREEEQL